MRVFCNGVAPLYAATFPKSLDSGDNNGWILTCYTGISNCVTRSNIGGADDVANVILDNVTSGVTESADCMNDPRYLTWRAMTMKLLINGTQSWYRVDSYWNSSKTMFSSTMGPGVQMSVGWIQSTVDNNGTENLGKTFVFAYGDGSGIQLNHITFGNTLPTGNSTSGGGDVIVSAPTSFTNSSPNLVNQNYCSSA